MDFSSVTGITESFLEEFDIRFYAFLRQQGSALIQGVEEVPVNGASTVLKQAGIGSMTNYTSIRSASRELEPQAFECSIIFDKFDIVRQGPPNIAQMAQEAASSCGELIDQIIVKGIGGPAKTNEGDVILPKSQMILANDTDLGGNELPKSLKYGLSTAKIFKAVEMLRSRLNNGPIICVANNYALSTLRADPRAASSQFNTIQAFATGIDAPYGGVNAFIACEQVDKGRCEIEGETGMFDCSYAYVYAMDQIKLGCSMPLHMEVGQNAERNLNTVLIYSGMYDCVRMQEEAVVKIEVAVAQNK